MLVLLAVLPRERAKLGGLLEQPLLQVEQPQVRFVHPNLGQVRQLGGQRDRFLEVPLGGRVVFQLLKLEVDEFCNDNELFALHLSRPHSGCSASSVPPR